MERSDVKKLSMMPDGYEFSSPYAGLGCGIIVRAVQDWRLLISQKAWMNRRRMRDGSGYNFGSVDFDELRRFFRCRWCDMLIPPEMSFRGDEMLEALEHELKTAKEKAGR